MKTKFITPVSMRCTKDQYERDLKKPLEELGIPFLTDGITIENFSFGDDHRVSERLRNLDPSKATAIKYYNPELFLALAAMTEGEEPIVGEWAILLCNQNKYIGEYKGMNNASDLHFSDKWKPLEGDFDWARHGAFDEIVRKATKEELIKHFAKDMKTEKEVKTRFINLTQAQSILSVACEEWKVKLFKKWECLFLGKLELVQVFEPFYKEMREACNDEQHKVLDEVFGKDEKSVEEEVERIIKSVIDRNEKGAKLVCKDFVNELLETFDIKPK